MTSLIKFPKQLIGAMIILSSIFLIWGCSPEGRGFALPKGDIGAGKAAFTKLGCDDCHSVGDIQLSGNATDLDVKLGGSTDRIKTYGELVTSVINPSHKISKKFNQVTTDVDGSSRMSIYNEVMTVQELVDIVTFLQDEYDLKIPTEYYYPGY